nr:putative pectinesterase/pectinesterase inhibitor 7 [Quercus suber]
MIDKYLKQSSTLTNSALQALEDCRQLAELNMDFLLSSFQTVNNTSKTLSSAKAEDIQTLLSAILTNEQTCLDGLQVTASAWSVRKGLTLPLSNDTKLYSVSLALFTKGWVPKKKQNTTWKPVKRQHGFRNGRLPLKMSSKTQAIYESVSRRKLIQSQGVDEEVAVSDIVTVSQDGSGNFTTINDAISAAPNNSALTDGYFLIYVTAGVYEEYVYIVKNKRNLMMVGDGINQTIITGNRSYVDNSTTFNSATFDGSGNFTTINDAISAAPNNSALTDGYFLIYVTAGVYEEYVYIVKNKRNLMMVGDGINQTIITGNRSYVDNSTTFNSATFAVVATGFVAVNITFRNTAGAIKHQAVAVRNGADLSTFYSCSFEAYQDTLYTHSLRQFYRECDIYGTVDFIFGNAVAVFQNCNIYPRLPMSGQFIAITAQGRTDPNQNTGISIQNCTIRAADELASSNITFQTYLGRPWKNYSRTIYMETFMDSLINPAGWIAWNGDFALSTLYYAEYDNTGPGSNTTNRVSWPTYHVINNDTEAANFTVANFLLADDWLPQTGVPYDGGFI